MSRAYDNTRRAAAAAETTDRIAAATEALLTEGAVGAVTLQAIAARAEVTVQTVLRHTGSREGCFAAVAARVGARIDAHRGHSPPGDVDAALAGLLTHYEADGRLVLALLGQESDDPWARGTIEQGRAYHRAWVERCLLPAEGVRDRERTLDALVAVTDLYVWKLLRLDLERSPAETAAILTHLVHAVREAA